MIVIVKILSLVVKRKRQIQTCEFINKEKICINQVTFLKDPKALWEKTLKDKGCATDSQSFFCCKSAPCWQQYYPDRK